MVRRDVVKRRQHVGNQLVPRYLGRARVAPAPFSRPPPPRECFFAVKRSRTARREHDGFVPGAVAVDRCHGVQVPSTQVSPGDSVDGVSIPVLQPGGSIGKVTDLVPPLTRLNNQPRFVAHSKNHAPDHSLAPHHPTRGPGSPSGTAWLYGTA